MIEISITWGLTIRNQEKMASSGDYQACKADPVCWAKRKARKVKEYLKCKADPECYRKRWDWSNKGPRWAGLTRDSRLDMARKQDFRCRICGKHEADMRWPGLVVDHDHSTGQVRGLLCTGCNTKLGWFENYTTSIVEYTKGQPL